MELQDLLTGYEEHMIRDIQELVIIPSVLDPTSTGPGMPFGREVARALDWFLDKARAMGFTVKNIDGYAGHVEYGQGEELLGVLAHLDVVPPGPGWDGDPYAAQIEGNKIVGRGVVDNKGPAVIALYALKALKDSKIPVDKRIRLIVGTDEESGMRCLDYYFQRETKPTTGFSPDADFPLIHAEKGILHLKLTWQAEGPISFLAGGERPNIVPQTAEARINQAAVRQDSHQLAEGHHLSVSVAGQDLVVTAVGKSSHASMPEKGQNAIALLLESLANLDLGEQKKVVEYLARVGRGIHGEGLNIAYSDEVSGKLTCNLGMISFGQGRGEAVIDVRSPVSLNLADIIDQARASLEQAGFTVQVNDSDPPHLVAKDSALVQSLLKVYREVTGDNREAMAIGGGTYARKLQGAVAFGPLLQGREEVAHIANEYMYLDDIKLCLEIYTKALLELCTNALKS